MVPEGMRDLASDVHAPNRRSNCCHPCLASYCSVPALQDLPCRPAETNCELTQGVPVRIEVGPKDVAQNACVTARRDRPGKAGKTFGVPMEPAAFLEAVQKLLAEVRPRSEYERDFIFQESACDVPG